MTQKLAHTTILATSVQKERGTMNKQPELIDADKLLEWINFEIAKKFPDDVRQYEDGRRSVMTLLKRRIEQGVFSPDPIPLPTIKPGEDGLRIYLRNTIDVMTYEQMKSVAKGLGLEVIDYDRG